MELFRIDNNDYTNFITVPSYAVNNVPEMYEWTDANYRKHRIKKREKVKGTFTLKFPSLSDFSRFRDDVLEHKNNDETVPAYAYVNNENTVVYRNFYIDFAPANEMPFYGVKETDGIAITIEEI